ncbi:MAG: hypothetical protein PUG09_08690 [Prevotella sp.]|nr:hypothetical protein [Prevotella sp.]
MDTRLSVMLPEVLGIKNGEVKIVKVAGGVICTVGAHTYNEQTLALWNQCHRIE